MFGYIEPDKGQLRLWEYEQYRAAYCGLCRSMGRHTGQLSRFTLNYDYVFLAVLRTAIEGKEPIFKPCRCLVHPMKKRAMALDDSVLKYCAEISTMLTYFKVLDNIADCHGVKRLAAMAAKPFCQAVYGRLDEISVLGKTVSETLSQLSELEKSADATPDSLAELFGKIMSEVFAYGLKDGTSVRIACEIGRHTGRYIYLADALDDVADDIKNGEFNPFVLVYGKDGLAVHTDEIKTAVLLELRELEAAINLLNFSKCQGYENIVRNIIYLGMPEKIGSIVNKPPYNEKDCTEDKSKTKTGEKYE